MLATVYKPLEELTRPDFETFREAYQRQYRETERRQDGKPDTRLTRLEFYLVQWGVLPPRRIIFQFEENFAKLRASPIRAAILNFMAWCEVKYQPSTINTRRAGLLNFCLWFQDTQPARTQLDDVTRPIALAYAHTCGPYGIRDLLLDLRPRPVSERAALLRICDSGKPAHFARAQPVWVTGHSVGQRPRATLSGGHELQAVLRYIGTTPR